MRDLDPVLVSRFLMLLAGLTSGACIHLWFAQANQFDRIMVTTAVGLAVTLCLT